MANHIPILFQVNPVLNDNPNINLNPTGNRANLTLNEALIVPEGKKAQIALKSFTCFYSFPNIQNGTMTFTNSVDANTFVLNFQTGLYDTRGFQNNVDANFDQNLFEMTDGNARVFFNPNFNTEKLQIQLEGFNIPPGESITLTMNQTLKDVTGFENPIVFVNGQTNYDADTFAHFNQINNLILKTSLLNSVGIQVSNQTARNQNILDICNINVKPGRQIIHQPNELYFYDISLSEPIQNINFEILDENGKDILINNSYMFNLIVRYYD